MMAMATTWEGGSRDSNPVTDLGRRGRVRWNTRLPMQKVAKRCAAAAISTKARPISRTAKHAAEKIKVQIDDEVDSRKGDFLQEYPGSYDLPPGYPDSGYISTEYHSDADGEIRHPPLSPSTKQQQIDNTRREHMVKASPALVYYHEKQHDDLYEPVHVNLEHVIHIIDIKGYYIHMNFIARNTETKAEKIFFAELFHTYEAHYTKGYMVTACDIIGPESRGGLRHTFVPNNILFVDDAMDIKNCYACYDYVKHLQGSTYQAGRRAHLAYSS